MLRLKSSNMDFDFVVDIVDAAVVVVDVVAVVGGADCGSGVIVVVI